MIFLDVLPFVVPFATLFGGWWLGSLSSRATEARAERRDASKALWNFHRALNGFVLAHSEQIEYGTGVRYVGKATWSEVQEAHKDAYRFAGYLPTALSKRFRGLWISTIDQAGLYEQHEVWEEEARSAGAFADELGPALEATFGRRTRKEKQRAIGKGEHEPAVSAGQ